MHQQLIEQTIQITPATMHQILPKIIQQLSQTTLTDKILEPITKSLFYGLWNFDKMINQHNLSTNISEMLTKIPKKNAFMFLHSLLAYLCQKWNLIDHHRINKFMQLVRYLVKQAMKISQKKLDDVLLKTVFSRLSERSGIVDHVIQLYFDTACEVFLNKNDVTAKQEILSYQKLEIFEKLLKVPSILETLGYHIIEKIYQKYKKHIMKQLLTADNQQQASEKIEQSIQAFNQHMLELAKNEQNDANRKNLYFLIGFMKSDHELVNLYMIEKKQKQEQERQKKTKKISKSKKQIIRQTKQKRKEKKKQGPQHKNAKVISKSKFQFTAREQMEKIMQ